jgi:hypothetical protein
MWRVMDLGSHRFRCKSAEPAAIDDAQCSVSYLATADATTSTRSVRLSDP